MRAKLSRVLHVGKAVLAKYFIGRNRDRVGKIEGAERREHRNPYAVVRVPEEDVLGNSGALFSEHEPGFFGIGYLGIDAGRLRGKEEEGGVGMLGKEGGRILVMVYVQKVPVVQARVSETLVVGRESQRVNQVQGAACHGAGAGNVARVLGDFGFVQYDVYVHVGSFTLFSFSIIKEKREFVHIKTAPLSYSAVRLRIKGKDLKGGEDDGIMIMDENMVFPD